MGGCECGEYVHDSLTSSASTMQSLTAGSYIGVMNKAVGLEVGWLFPEHIQGCLCHLTRLQGSQQGVLINDASTRHVHNASACMQRCSMDRKYGLGAAT